MSVQVDVNAAYVELVAKQMVSCGTTKQNPGFPNQWTVDCQLYHGGNKEKAKEGIAEFLRFAWRATDIVFFTKHGAKPGQFWVRFTSVDF